MPFRYYVVDDDDFIGPDVTVGGDDWWDGIKDYVTQEIEGFELIEWDTDNPFNYCSDKNFSPHKHGL